MSSPAATKLLPPLFRFGGRRLLSGGAAAATTARQVTGTHLHWIEGYSLLEKSMVSGDSVSSNPFLVGDRWWQLRYYPNGIDPAHRGFVSVDLALAPREYGHGGVTASYRVSILDHAANPAHTAAVGPRRFGDRDRFESLRRWGQKMPAAKEELLRKTAVKRLVAKEELWRLAPWLVGDDYLHVKCDVTVTELKTT
ncbi:unnamed protein product [Urochloa humidicola]